MSSGNKQAQSAQKQISPGSRRLFLTLFMIFVMVAIVSGVTVSGLHAEELQNSEIDIALHQLRYSVQERITGYTSSDKAFDNIDKDLADDLAGDFGTDNIPGRKSVLKAGILSLLIPGLGQVYNGSHIGKVALFAGADVALILGASKFNSDGNDKVAEFRAFARANWNEQDYWNYLNHVYGDTTDVDDNLGGNHGHHLPTTQTQQYFEMIGKYDQFSYGWARAEDFEPNDTLPWDTASTPANKSQYEYDFENRYPSQLRLDYNQMRADANDKFGKRDKMVIFVMVNHVVSSVDAIVSAHRHNKELEGAGGSVSFHPSVRHDENWGLIPEVKLSLRF